MTRFDRYMLSQLLTLFGFFSLILVLVYWVNRAVSLFDRLIADGQTAWVFLELTSLSLPGLIRIMLPISAFVSAVYVTNRMSSESELLVVQATGYSPFRLARPVIYFGLIVAGMTSVLTHVLVPLSSEQLSVRSDQISQDMTARLLTPGEFLTPVDDVTFYIREINSSGEMLDIFLSDGSGSRHRTTYTAARAYLVRTDDGPQLVMVGGLAQTLDTDTNRLVTTGFDDFVFNLGSLINTADVRRRTPRGLSTWDLLNPTPAILEETDRSANALRLRAHDRFAQSALAFVAGLVAFSALLAGGFNQFGLWRNIVLAVFLGVVLKLLETAGTGLAETTPALWPLVYSASIGGVLVSVALLYVAGHPSWFKRGVGMARGVAV